MAIWLSCDFTGGAIGTTASLATEPQFIAANGTSRVYAAAVGGGTGQSIQSAATASGDFTLDLTGHTHWRVCFDIRRISGTQTAGMLALTALLGTTNVGDIFLRNQGGGEWALRNNFTYRGQMATPMLIGDTNHLELEWEQGVGFTFDIWLPGTPSTSPADDTFTAANTTSTIDHIRIGNATGNTGVSIGWGNLRVTDGESLWGNGVTPGTVTFSNNGYADASTITVKAKVANATTVHLEATAVATMVGAEATPDADGYVTVSVSGLTANTAYTWELFVDNTSRATGTSHTMPPAGGQESFTFGWASCFDTFTSGVFTLIAARNPLFWSMLGDYGYQYITGGANGNIAPSDLATVRAQREPVLTATTPRTLFASFPFHYTYSDCDGGGANADGTFPGFVSGAVQAAYRQQFSHPSLPLSDCGARSWVVGRIRFIQTDETTLASAKANADDASKTKLGASQKAWFKTQIDAAVAAGQVVVWLADGPWIEPTSTSNSWARYNTERTEIGNYIATAGVRIVRLHGDTHTLFCDDGTNNSWGGFPTASAAPMHTTAQPYGYPTSGPSWPTVATNSSRQYGIAEVADTGSEIAITLHGYSSTNSAPTEVERYTMSLTFSMSTPINSLRVGSSTPTTYKVGANDVAAIYLGDVKIYSDT